MRSRRSAARARSASSRITSCGSDGGGRVAVDHPLLQALHVLRPLGVVSTGLQVIADGQGDLTRRIEVRSHDEIGQLFAGLATLQSRQRDTLAQLIAPPNDSTAPPRNWDRSPPRAIAPSTSSNRNWNRR